MTEYDRKATRRTSGNGGRMGQGDGEEEEEAKLLLWWMQALCV